MSAPSSKQSSASPLIEPEATASGATPKISGGTSSCRLPLTISVRLMMRMGTNSTANTMSTIIVTRPLRFPFAGCVVCCELFCFMAWLLNGKVWTPLFSLHNIAQKQLRKYYKQAHESCQVFVCEKIWHIVTGISTFHCRLKHLTTNYYTHPSPFVNSFEQVF